MNPIKTILTLCFVLGFYIPANGHVFTLQDGRSIDTEIVEYNTSLGTVKLKRKDGHCISVKPTVFVDADQEYIKDWTAISALKNPNLLKIESDDSIEKWNKSEEQDVSYEDGSIEKETVSETKFKKYTYTLKINNKSTSNLKDLQFKYRIFYEQDERNAVTKTTIEKVLSGVIKPFSLRSKQIKSFETKPLTIWNKEYSGNITYNDRSLGKEKGAVRGIWIRLYAKGMDGEDVLVQEIFDPSSIEKKYKWQK